MTNSSISSIVIDQLHPTKAPAATRDQGSKEGLPAHHKGQYLQLLLCQSGVPVVEIHATFSGARDRPARIYQQIRAAILDGRLRAGEPLAPSRELAERLKVARNTVLAAYDRLAGEGFVTGRVGAGTFVVGPLPLQRAKGSDGRPSVGMLRPRAFWDTVLEPPDLSAVQPPFSFRPGLPDARLFPYETWRRLLARELRPAAVGTGHYGNPAGHPGFRAAIARHVDVSRGVRADAADLIVTNGIQQAVDLVGRVLLDRAAQHPPGLKRKLR